MELPEPMLDAARVAERLSLDSGWHEYRAFVKRTPNGSVVIAGEVLVDRSTAKGADELRNEIRALQQQLAKLKPRNHRRA